MLTVTDKEGNKVEVDPDDVLEVLSEGEILTYLETHHGFEWRDPGDFDLAVEKAIDNMKGEDPDYKGIVDAFWQGDFDFEKFFSALGKEGMKKLRLMAMNSDL